MRDVLPVSLKTVKGSAALRVFERLLCNEDLQNIRIFKAGASTNDHIRSR